MASNNDSGCDVPTDSCAPSNCDSVDMQALRRLHGDFTPAEQEELEEWSGATCWAEILELNCDFLMGDSVCAMQPVHIAERLVADCALFRTSLPTTWAQ